MAYPCGMRFPHAFKDVYPFRGRGKIARGLYWMNRLRLDQLILKRTRLEEAVFAKTSDVAYFWPSALRSKERFYGYRVKDGSIVEYQKFATTDGERRKLECEVSNAKQVFAIRNRVFEVPRCIDVDDVGGWLRVRYEPLPADAHNVPNETRWLKKAEEACAQLHSFGLIHGDFAVHNLKVAGGKLWILDWEEMTAGANELIDRIVLNVTFWRYIQGLPSPQVWTNFANKFLDENKRIDLPKVRDAVKDLAVRKIAFGDFLLTNLTDEGGK